MLAIKGDGIRAPCRRPACAPAEPAWRTARRAAVFPGAKAGCCCRCAGGQQLGWGFQLGNPGVVAGLAVLFTVIGLNLAGLFEFGRMVPSSLAGLQLRHPLADAFMTGACSRWRWRRLAAPFAGASLEGLAIGLPTLQALAVFAAIGIGMALPIWPRASSPVSRGPCRDPAPGCRTLRQFMAFRCWQP